ncbi:MAG: hypothetical protein ACR2K4_04455 [Candidatus Limnocylindria bacterium]
MRHHPSPAERLDHAVDRVLGGETSQVASTAAGLAPEMRGLVTVATQLRVALPALPASPRFEARLGTRLAAPGGSRDPVAWALRHPGRLIVTGAVGSAVGVGVTAYAVWRTTRRAPAVHRLLHR